MFQIVQIAGAMLILIAFGLAQARRMHVESISYLALNEAGALLLAASAIADRQWGFIILEGAWALISAWSLLNVLRRSGAAPRA